MSRYERKIHMTENERGELMPNTIPLAPREAIDKTDAKLREQKQRLIAHDGHWLLVDLAKARTVSFDDIEQMGRKMGAIDDVETVSWEG